MECVQCTQHAYFTENNLHIVKYIEKTFKCLDCGNIGSIICSAPSPCVTVYYLRYVQKLLYIEPVLWIRISLGNRVRIRIRVKQPDPDPDQMQEPALMSKSGAEVLTMEVRRLKMEAWRLEIEQWRVCSPVEADSHHFKKELDSDPN
jgi:hypothetical protein